MRRSRQHLLRSGIDGVAGLVAGLQLMAVWLVMKGWRHQVSAAVAAAAADVALLSCVRGFFMLSRNRKCSADQLVLWTLATYH